MEFIAVKSIHILSILILFACLVSEWALLSPQLTRLQIKRLSIIDAIYGLSSVTILISGFYIALSIGKGKDFYFDNSAIYFKLFLFVIVGCLSIYPTFYFLKNRKGVSNEVCILPTRIHKIIISEIILVLLIPVFAVLLASGVHL